MTDQPKIETPIQEPEPVKRSPGEQAKILMEQQTEMFIEEQEEKFSLD